MPVKRRSISLSYQSSDTHDEITDVDDAVRCIVQRLRVSGRAAEQRFGISGAQLFILNELVHGPAQSINSLADRTFTHQSSVSMVVSRLVERRLAERTPGHGDARRVGISITAAGRALVRRAPDAAQARLVEALQKMPRADMRALAKNLTTLTTAIEKDQVDDVSRRTLRARRA
jgi:DNA-binding MarR family transcriptional regulator